MTEQRTATLEKDWVNIAFLTLTPVLAIPVTAWYTWHNGFHAWMAILFVTMYSLVGLSICAGYHRYFSHKSYDCSPIVQAFYAFFGAMAAQNSILWWSASHRVHHKHVDEDWDPYNIQRGFWWAHILWIFYRNPASGNLDNAKDLQKNKVVMWQHRWHKVILIAAGFGIPTFIGWLCGDAIAGLLWGGFLRITVVHHTTFFVNSLAHKLGTREFSPDVSARDNWLVALVTLGEGYHSFHHRFPADFRNGIRWYHWDPAKWFIGAISSVGLARSLKTTPPPMIEQARLIAALRQIEAKIEAHESPVAAEVVRGKIADAKAAIEHAVALWRQQAEERASAIEGWRAKRRESRRRLKFARREWRSALRLLSRPQQAV
jgi:stearoyl-CoA desaturase (delta-9 desaturase)